MNFRVQALIQDLANMGSIPGAVSKSEWEDKWNLLKELSPAEYDAVRAACQEGSRAVAWKLIAKHDPDPAKTERSSAFLSLFDKP